MKKRLAKLVKLVHKWQYRASRAQKSRVTLDNLFEQMSQGEMKELNLIIKADVQGSVEALASSLMKIDVEGVNVKIIHTGVGAITESDIILQRLPMPL